MTAPETPAPTADADPDILRGRALAALTTARARTALLTTAVDEPDLTAQHSPLMSPLVWDLAHIGNQEELWLLRNVAGREAMRPEIDGLYDAFEHPRAELIIGDGLAYLRDVSQPFDVILVDSTDPVGPAEGLISEEFYRLAAGALSGDGIFAMQTGSPLLMRDELDAAASRMRSVFPIVGTYLGHVPSYPGVLWSWTAGSKTLDPSVPRRSPPPGLRYYTPEVHRAAFALPGYLAPAAPEGARDGAAAAAARGPILG